MADENLRGDAEELESPVVEATEETAGLVDEVAEQIAESTEQAAESIEQAAEAEALDEMVEIAVENVAKEAAAENAAEEATEAEDSAEVSLEQATDAAPAKKRERRSKQARAEKAARTGASEPVAATTASKTATYGLPVLIAAAVGCLALGLVLGRFVLGGGAGGAASGKTAVTEAELDNAYANYTYKGETNAVTFREVIEMNGSLESAVDTDGNYKIPAAENALNAARTAILNKEIESRGIEVTDEEVAAYAEQSLGTSDFDAIASTYGMEADAVKELVEENCRLGKLRDEIIDGEVPAMPEAPEAAEEGKEDEATEAYAEYILTLVGDQWDSEKGAWVDESSSYATALAEYKFDGKTASYNAAQAAYYVAYQEYTTKSQEISNQWTEFLNGLLSNASIEISSMVS